MALSEGERITVALVRGLHGLGGAVRVEVLSDAPDRFRRDTVLYVEGDDRPLTVAWSGLAKPGLLLRFVEITTREAAEVLRDRYLEVVPDTPLPEGTFYWHEIVGLEVRATDGEVLGRVSEVFRAGAGEVYVVTGGPRGEILVPALRAIVTELSPSQGRLLIDPAVMALPALPTPEAPAGAEPAEPAEPAGEASAAEDAERTGEGWAAGSPEPGSSETPAPDEERMADG